MTRRGCPSMAARRSFGAGFACGLLLAGAGLVLKEQASARSPEDAVARAAPPATGAAWKHPGPSGDLEAAVRLSAGLMPAARPVVRATGAPVTGSVPELLARAEEHRRSREFDRANALYAAVVARNGMTADAWADYADAQASASGRLAGAPARAIEAALRLEPGHAKALWLRASLQHEERRYADALVTWRRLQALVPPDSSDAKIIRANIAEATRLAAG